jgi:hypothetical protein
MNKSNGFYVSGMTKLLVGLGDVVGTQTSDTIEIIDLESSTRTFNSLPNFPSKLEVAIGGLGFQEKPIICGGQNSKWVHSNKCFSLEGNEWTPSPSLNTVRAFATISPSPYPFKSHKFIAIGGLDGDTRLDTAEILTEKGNWETLRQSLPVTLSQHCSVLVNSTTVMVIGGFQYGLVSSNTYFFNIRNEVWIEGPQLKQSRFEHSCGRIRKGGQSQEFSIIVAGGNDKSELSSKLSSVEILDQGSNEWRKGPGLPFEIDKAQMVDDPNGGVVLVGGSSDYDEILDTLFQLPHGGEDAEWIELEQTLNVGRRSHVAFLVPDNIVDCS